MPARAALALSLSAALLLAACGPRLPEAPNSSPQLAQIREIQTSAEANFNAGRWDDAAAEFRRIADVAGDDARLGGWRDRAVYNLACVHARAGRRDEAATAFAQSIAHGLRPLRMPDRGGNWIAVDPAISLPHILADPDLATIRDLPAFTEAMKPYLGGGAEGVGWVLAEIGEAAADGGRLPVVVAFSSPGMHVARGALAGKPGEADKPDNPEKLGERAEAPTLVPLPEVDWWRKSVTGAPPFLLAEARGPVCGDPPTETKLLAAAAGQPVAMPFRRWLLEDGDERWAVAHAGRVLDAAAAAGRADAERIILVGEGRDAATAAWAAALAMPERVAGICAVGAVFHKEAWADAVAAVPAKRAGKSPWKVIVGPSDEAAAAAMKSIGIEVTRTDPASARRAAVDAATAR